MCARVYVQVSGKVKESLGDEYLHIERTRHSNIIPP